MRKTKVNKRKTKYSKKTIKAYRKNKNICEKGITDEVLRLRGLIKELRNKNKKTQKNKPLPKDISKDKSNDKSTNDQ
jgi:hypothetical protein